MFDSPQKRASKLLPINYWNYVDSYVISVAYLVHCFAAVRGPMHPKPVNRLVAGSNPARGAKFFKDLPPG